MGGESNDMRGSPRGSQNLEISSGSPPRKGGGVLGEVRDRAVLKDPSLTMLLRISNIFDIVHMVSPKAWKGDLRHQSPLFSSQIPFPVSETCNCDENNLI